MLKFETLKSEKVKVVTCIQDWPPGDKDAKTVLDIRTWVKAKDGRWCSTMKGVQIPIEDAELFSRKLRATVKRDTEANTEV